MIGILCFSVCRLTEYFLAVTCPMPERSQTLPLEDGETQPSAVLKQVLSGARQNMPRSRFAFQREQTDTSVFCCLPKRS